MFGLEAKHCPLCSADLATVEVRGRPRRRCTRCRFVLYLNPATASAGVVLNGTGEVLLVRRNIEPYRGFWALPAGYQEIDEEPEETVVREVREESGIDVRVLGLLDLLFVPDDPRKPANVSVFLCSQTGGSLRPGGEETEAGWFGLDALPERIGFDNYPRILRRLRAADGYPESPWNLLWSLLHPGTGPPRRGGGDPSVER